MGAGREPLASIWEGGTKEVTGEAQTLAQPETWQQRVGTKGAEIAYEPASRQDVLDLIWRLKGACQRSQA